VKAVLHERFGAPRQVLDLKDVDPPRLGDKEVLVRVRAASVNAGDAAVVAGMPYIIRPVYGFARPRKRLFGSDISGVVEEVGWEVDGIEPGDEVYGKGEGAFAEQVVARPGRIAPKPSNLSFEESAALPVAGLTALQGLRDAAGLSPGQKVLINGASGGVGTFAVQIAKTLGAEVTAVCSTGNAETARSLGADRVVDYTVEDFTKTGERYDVVFDNAASRSLSETRMLLTPRGILIPNNGNLHSRWLASLPRMIGAMAMFLFFSQRARMSPQTWDHDDLVTLKDLVEAGKVKPVVDRVYQLAQTAEAVEYVGEGHARGKVVITV
jgi:NADPH:quinone reductase-like Zn-dependent oxidoreductase